MNIWNEFAKETNGTFKEGYSWNSDYIQKLEKLQRRILLDELILINAIAVK